MGVGVLALIIFLLLLFLIWVIVNHGKTQEKGVKSPISDIHNFEYKPKIASWIKWVSYAIIFILVTALLIGLLAGFCYLFDFGGNSLTSRIIMKTIGQFVLIISIILTPLIYHKCVSKCTKDNFMNVGEVIVAVLTLIWGLASTLVNIIFPFLVLYLLYIHFIK